MATATEGQLELAESNGKPLIESPGQQSDVMVLVQNSSLPAEQLQIIYNMLREEREDRRKQAFTEAMNQFKANPPDILKSKLNDNGKFKYMSADLFDVCDAVGTALSRYGISHRWETETLPPVDTPIFAESKDGSTKIFKLPVLRVTCILTHRDGYSVKTTLEGPADLSGAKNIIQAIGSAKTYLERYTLLSASGCAAKNMDNDGAGAPKMEDLQDWLDAIKDSPNERALLDNYTKSHKIAHDHQDKNAMEAIRKAKTKRLEELRK